MRERNWVFLILPPHTLPFYLNIILFQYLHLICLLSGGSLGELGCGPAATLPSRSSLGFSSGGMAGEQENSAQNGRHVYSTFSTNFSIMALASKPSVFSRSEQILNKFQFQVGA